jgi:hypothetical protein
MNKAFHPLIFIYIIWGVENLIIYRIVDSGQ